MSETVITLLFLGGESGVGVQLPVISRTAGTESLGVQLSQTDMLKFSGDPLTNDLVYGPDPSIPSQVCTTLLKNLEVTKFVLVRHHSNDTVLTKCPPNIEEELRNMRPAYFFDKNINLKNLRTQYARCTGGKKQKQK